LIRNHTCPPCRRAQHEVEEPSGLDEGLASLALDQEIGSPVNVEIESVGLAIKVECAGCGLHALLSASGCGCRRTPRSSI
jgi:hypothetical protein